MLATATRHLEGDLWAYDAKLDGWRAVVHVGASGVAVYSRPGRNITAALPGLQPLAGVVPEGSVLDGELVAGSGGASSFYRLAPVMATPPARRPVTVTFVAFDVLALGGRRTMSAPYRERRRLLEGLALLGPAWCTSRCWTAVCLDDLLSACESLDIEGVVAKRLDSPYSPGRSRHWVKMKTPAWRIEHGPYRHEHDRGARHGGGRRARLHNAGEAVPKTAARRRRIDLRQNGSSMCLADRLREADACRLAGSRPGRRMTRVRSR